MTILNPLCKKNNRNFFYKLIFICLLLVLSLQISHAKPKIINIHIQSFAMSEYFRSLLEISLSKTDPTKYKLQFKESTISQGRIIKELQRKNGIADLIYTGTSIEREKDLIAIRIPLLKGTLGYRVPVIHKDNKEKFEKVKNLKDLQQFTACQGEHWPDSDILEASNLKVLRNDKFKSMFEQTRRKYCDYFPRAITEAYSELITFGLEDSGLIVFDDLLITYPFAMYFFVPPNQQELANDIKRGLEIAIEDGSFDNYFKNHQTTRELFPLSKWKNTVIIKIPNPTLSKDTPIDDPKLWLQLN